MYFVGLDISLNSTSICIVDRDGNVWREATTGTDPGEIEQFLLSCDVRFERIGLEAGNLSIWLHHELSAKDWPIICIETRHAKAAMMAQQMKTDRNDARGIAQMMRTGWFKPVHIKSHESQKLRVLLNNRRCLLDKRLDIEGQIRETLKVFGLKTGKVTAASYESRIRELIEDDEELQAYVFPLLEARRHMREQFMLLERMIMEVAKRDDVCRRLMTIPGVGVLTALVFKTAIDRPERFAKSRNVGAALGLTPRKYASGEMDYDGRITKCGDVMARNHLFEAAQVLLSRVNKWSALKAWGLRIAQRSTFRKACVAVARRLAVIMHRMWVDGTEFRWSNEEKLAA